MDTNIILRKKCRVTPLTFPSHTRSACLTTYAFKHASFFLCFILPMFSSFLYILVSTSESTLTSRRGRVRALHPPEYSLSQFLLEVKNPHPSWDTHTFACSWSGVECNEAKQITSVLWYSRNLKGTLHWRQLSHLRMKHLRLYDNKLAGEVLLDQLPENMTALGLYLNSFSGPLDLVHLPAGMEVIGLQYNQFSGWVELSHLPPSLNDISLLSNQNLCGELDVSHLPYKVQFIWGASFVHGTQIKVLPRHATYFPTLRYVFDSDVWRF